MVAVHKNLRMSCGKPHRRSEKNLPVKTPSKEKKATPAQEFADKNIWKSSIGDDPVGHYYLNLTRPGSFGGLQDLLDNLKLNNNKIRCLVAKRTQMQVTQTHQ